MDKETMLKNVNNALNDLDKVYNLLSKVSKELSKEDKKDASKQSTSFTLKELASSVVDLDGTTREPLAKEEKQNKDFKELNSINQKLEIKHCLEHYSCFNELEDKDEFINDIIKIMSNNNISIKQLDSTLERIKYANDRQQKEDIKKYTYSCLYKVAK